MFANFTITVSSAVNAIAVPQSAVVREGDGAMSVWITKNGRHFIRKTVKIGQIQNDLDEIVDGTPAGRTDRHGRRHIPEQQTRRRRAGLRSLVANNCLTQTIEG